MNTPGAVPTIWSYGHRNPQGLAWDPITGRLWESEHGPSGGDEINIIEPGRNYGWGVVSKGLANGITKRSQPGMEEPLTYYTPAIGPSTVAFYTGDRFPAWKNTSLFVAGMAGHQLRRLQIADDKITAEEVIFGQFGRVRDIVQGPDGYLVHRAAGPDRSGHGPRPVCVDTGPSDSARARHQLKPREAPISRRPAASTPSRTLSSP